CWNPVLFDVPGKSLTLFYKVGPSPQTWWGMARTSGDGGRTWSDARRLPDGILGPVKNKPVLLPDGTLLAGSSTESTDRPSVWRVHFERSADGGVTWTSVSPPAASGGNAIDAIQPSILVHPGGRLQAVGRTRAQRDFGNGTADGGRTWTPLALTSLPNPNSGIDAVTLRDGRQLIVYNHTTQGRSPLNVAVSRDGKTWDMAVVLESEPGEYSYPAVIQSADGLVHVTYTWKRQRINHPAIDPPTLPSPDTRACRHSCSGGRMFLWRSAGGANRTNASSRADAHGDCRVPSRFDSRRAAGDDDAGGDDPRVFRDDDRAAVGDHRRQPDRLRRLVFRADERRARVHAGSEKRHREFRHARRRISGCAQRDRHALPVARLRPPRRRVLERASLAPAGRRHRRGPDASGDERSRRALLDSGGVLHVPRQPAAAGPRPASARRGVGRRLGRLPAGVDAVVRRRQGVLQCARPFLE